MTATIGGRVGGTPLELDAEAEELEGAPLEATTAALEDEKLGGALVAVLELGTEDELMGALVAMLVAGKLAALLESIELLDEDPPPLEDDDPLFGGGCVQGKIRFPSL